MRVGKFTSCSLTDHARRWLDTDMVMIDANFRLKMKDRDIDDPPLGPGLSYYVEDSQYKEHVKRCGPQTEVRMQHFTATVTTNAELIESDQPL